MAALIEATEGYPGLREAVTYALKAVGEAHPRPADPVSALAGKLLQFQQEHPDLFAEDRREQERQEKKKQQQQARAASPGSSKKQQMSSAGNKSLPSSPRPGAGGAGGDAEDDAAEAAKLAAARSRGKNRRMVVFSEPVRLDKEFKPTIIPKTDGEKREIEAVLMANILFKGMDSDARNLIVDAMALKTFDKGAVIIEQGAPGDFYYIVADGTCEVLVNGNKVLETGKGKGFGELALMYDAPRAATVVATSEVVRAWAVDRVTFKQVMIGEAIRKRELYESFLSRVPIFSTLTREEILTIADAFVPEEVKAGTVVVQQGDEEADRFYVVEEGELKAEIEGVEGEVCDRLKSGSYFGERALIMDVPRAATVTAVADSKLLAMDRAAFLRLLGPIQDVLARSIELYERYVPQKR